MGLFSSDEKKEDAPKKGAADAAAALDDANDVKPRLKDGDQTVIIDIVEVRDLKPAEAGGSCDPCVTVTIPGMVMPYRGSTTVKYDTLSTMFNEQLHFEMKNVEREDLEAAIITVGVYDAAAFGCANGKLVGEFSFDLPKVYEQKGHEYYKQWVALMDPSGEVEGIQGYLKVGVCVLGEGDEQVVHSQTEGQEGTAGIFAGGSGMMSGVMMPPRIIQEKWLVCSQVLMCEGLAKLDMNFTFRKDGGCDPYVALQFSEHEPVTTSVINSNINPVFLQQLEVPVVTPTMVDKVTVSVWDKDMVSDDAVGAVRMSFKGLPSCIVPGQGITGPPVGYWAKWYNLYGSMPEQGAGLFDSWQVSLSSQMNQGIVPGVMWRGRILMSCWKRLVLSGRATRASYDLPIKLLPDISLSLKQPDKEDVNPNFVEDTITQRQIDTGIFGDLPMTTSFTLRFDLYEGVEMPQESGFFDNIPGWSSGPQLHVEVECGNVKQASKDVEVINNRCTWNEAFPDMTLHYPNGWFTDATDSSMPDIFVYLCRGKARIAYMRYNAKDISDATKDRKRDDVMPSWTLMVEEPCADAFVPGEIPGYLLFNIALGESSKVEATKRPGMMQKMETDYKLRFHLYQGKELPAKDENGAMDPYLVIRYNGAKIETKAKLATCYPRWYETFEFDVKIPEPVELSPEVICLLYDQDFDAKGARCDQMVGRFSLPMDGSLKARVTCPEEPQWCPIYLEKPGDTTGAILCSFSCVDASKAAKYPVAKLEPQSRKSVIELTILGVRDMDTFMGMPVAKPWVQFDMGEGDNRQETDKSSRPMGSNANHLQTLVFKTPLPEKGVFCPTLNMRVLDFRAGGFTTPLVGMGNVELADKMPWSETYVPPSGPLIDLLKEQELDAQQEKAKAAGDTGKVIALEAKEMGRDIAKGMAWIRKKASTAALEIEQKWNEDEEGDVPKWMLGRPTLGQDGKPGAVEDNFKEKAAICSWPLKRGELKPPPRRGIMSLVDAIMDMVSPDETEKNRQVGLVKGYVRIYEDKDPDPATGKVAMPPLPFDMNELLTETKVAVRCYITQCFNLTPMDLAGVSDLMSMGSASSGGQGKSDPFPVVELGKEKFYDTEMVVMDDLNPGFYKCYAMSTSLPGVSMLKVSIYDWDLLGDNDLIGTTKIDLETLWYNAEWQAMDKKPLERRTLWNPQSRNSQGQVEMFTEIMTTDIAKKTPIIDIAPPPPEKYELRIIIWKARNIKSEPKTDMPGESIGPSCDMKVQVKVQGLPVQQMSMYEKMMSASAGNTMGGLEALYDANTRETDIHWYAGPSLNDKSADKDKCEGIFNWRMIWPCEFNMMDLQKQEQRIEISVYGENVVSNNELLGQCTLEASDMFKKAWKSRRYYIRMMWAPQYFALEALPGADKKWWQKLTANGKDAGEVQMSCEVMHYEVARYKPAGPGRGEPNLNPTLPEAPRFKPWELKGSTETIVEKQACGKCTVA